MGAVTKHMDKRIRCRCGFNQNVEALSHALWAVGHPAERKDFLSFGARRRVGREYRVAIWKGRAYMIVRDGRTQKFITVFER